jgi:hypothetical protein
VERVRLFHTSLTSPRRRLLGAVAVGALCSSLALVPAWSVDDRDTGRGDRTGAPDGRGSTVLGVPRHSSDDALRDPSLRPREQACPGPRKRIDRSWRVARGIHARKWDRKDHDGKPIRLSLLTVRYGHPRVRLDYLGPAVIGNTRPTSTWAERGDAIAAVNADFFDISDTGAPLGMGIDRRRGVLHGTRDGWVPELGYQPALWVQRGTPRIGPLRTRVRMAQHPRWRLDALNSPRVAKGEIGVYTRAWGSTSGVSVTDGHQGREVVVEKGRVVRNRWGLSANRPIRRGPVLVGRGDAARQLKTLEVGQRVRLRQVVDPVEPPMAISGDRFVLRDGKRMVTNDAVRAPRTTVGIDRDRGRLLMLVVDGRQQVSCGATMVQMARLMRQLGAEDALNLDGGGSSTLWTRRRNGAPGVVNSPSDGSERPVANALGIHYRKR